MSTDSLITKTILVVEDVPLQSEMICEALRLLPAKVDSVLTADAALKQLLTEENLERPYDLMTLDMWLPQLLAPG